MKFMQLPESIQEIAAKTLSEIIVIKGLNKEDANEASRLLAEVFVGMYLA